MKIICDTNALLFWANDPSRLTTRAYRALEAGRDRGELACADISLWEIALLWERGRLRLPGDVTPQRYMHGLIDALRLTVVPITPEIAALSRSEIFDHGDPADRLIAATALHKRLPLVTSDTKLHAILQLETLW